MSGEISSSQQSWARRSSLMFPGGKQLLERREGAEQRSDLLGLSQKMEGKADNTVW